MRVALIVLMLPFVLLGMLWQCAAAAFLLGRSVVADAARDFW